MLILDENGAVVTDLDLEAGCLEERHRNIVHRYVVDMEEENHEEIVAEYPETGGKDVAIVIDVEEQGHWETRIETGEVVEFEGIIPDDTPHEIELHDAERYMLYRLYTADELAEKARREEEHERAKAEEAEREKFIAAAPARLDSTEANQADTDEAMCELYETTLAQQATIDEQDAAICALYEMQLGGAE